MGFSDRADSFDLNVTLQDHFQGVKKEEKISQESHEPQPQLDLAFKEGQTIKVNINIPKSDKVKTARPKTWRHLATASCRGYQTSSQQHIEFGELVMMIVDRIVSVTVTFQIPGAASLTPLTSPVSPTAQSVIGSSSASVDLLGLGNLDLNTPAAPAPAPARSDDPWGDFASADSGAKPSGNWVQF